MFMGGIKMIYGYARVSSRDQKLDRQIMELMKFGIKKENIYYTLYNIYFSNPWFVYFRFNLDGKNVDYIDVRNKCNKEQYDSAIIWDEWEKLIAEVATCN